MKGFPLGMVARGMSRKGRTLLTPAAGVGGTSTSDLIAKLDPMKDFGSVSVKVRGREYLPQSYDALLPEYIYGPPTSSPFPSAHKMPTDLTIKDAGAMVRKMISTRLANEGAFVFRGMPMRSGMDFSEFTQALKLEVPTKKIGGGLTPRKDVAKNVRTASVDPPVVTVEPHSDHCHASLMPDILIFLCIDGPPPGHGGETVVTNMRKVTEEMDHAGITAMFNERGGIKYLKKLWSSETVEHSFTWQDRFFVSDRAELATYLQRNKVEDWSIDDDGVLTYSNTLPATRTHPVTGEELFVNAAHSNHYTYHEAKLYEITPADAPADTLFANGEPIPYEVLAQIRKSLWTNSFAVVPQKGDLFVIDNKLAYHCRMGWDASVARTLLISDASYPVEAFSR